MTPNEKKLIDETIGAERDLLKRVIDEFDHADSDPRWLAIAKTHFEEGFMALRRAVRQGKRTDE